MNIYYFGLLKFSLIVFSLLFAYKVRNNKVRFIPLLTLSIMFFLTPINLTERSDSYRFVAEREELKEKVSVSKKDFEKEQEEKLKELKKQSKESLDEIIE